MDETTKSFEEIVGTIRGVNDSIDELNGVNKQLEGGIADISDLITSLSAASEENAATAQELNATTDLFNNNVQDLELSGDSVQRSAVDLNDIIREFKIDGGSLE